MYATTFFATSQTLTGCLTVDEESSDPKGLQEGSNGEPALPSVTDADLFMPCAKYKDLGESYGYCVYKHSGGFRNVKEIDLFCTSAGTWEQECRHAWVSGRMQPSSGFTIEELLQACGDNPDCTFELIDFRPDPDILVQIDRCTKYVKKHIRDCVGHSMQRWYMSDLTADDITHIMSQASSVPDKVAYYVAASVQCDGIGSCSGEPYVERLCRKNVKQFKTKPNQCPAKTEKKMHNFDPKELTPSGGTNQIKVKKPPQGFKRPKGKPSNHPNKNSNNQVQKPK